MTQAALLRYCLDKTGAYLDHPFGPDCDIVKVKGRIFAQLFHLQGQPMVTFNGAALRNDFYRRQYPDHVTRGYHCPPVQQPYFNTVRLAEGIPDDVLLDMADQSYDYVVTKLSKVLRQELLSSQALQNGD